MQDHPTPAPDDGLSRRGLLQRGAVVAGAAAGAPQLLTAPTAKAAATPKATAKEIDYARIPDYLGYRRADYAKPWAKYFTETVSAVQPQYTAALRAGPTPAADVPAFADLPAEMHQRGYSKVETGYATNPDGSEWYAGLTRMPHVTPVMWDWWFGWHSSEPSRYKLWHPEAHLHTTWRRDLADEPGLTDKQRYIGNTSYVEEVIPDYRGARRYYGDKAGAVLAAPAITFAEPASEHFDLSRFDGTIIVGRGGQQPESDTDVFFVHQVRAVKGGSEMRSRFYRQYPAAARRAVKPAEPARAVQLAARQPLSPSLANGLPPGFGMLHLGQEMNHLARFLPALYAEFRHDKKRRRTRG